MKQKENGKRIILFSKKIILTAVGLATLLALGLTGTNPFNLARNVARNFGLGFGNKYLNKINKIGLN